MILWGCGGSRRIRDESEEAVRGMASAGAAARVCDFDRRQGAHHAERSRCSFSLSYLLLLPLHLRLMKFEARTTSRK